MKKYVLIIGVVLGLLGWSCSKIETPKSSLGLKQSIENSTTAINSAVSNIAQTEGYKLLTSSADPTAKDSNSEAFKDSITLAMIAGIYDYQPNTAIVFHHNLNFPFMLFKKTGTSDKMIVNLPQKLSFYPRYLHGTPADSVQSNNFMISASDYHLYYTPWQNLDYKLSADLELDSVGIGSFDVAEVSSSFNDQSYSSQYTFTDGYSISTAWQAGDTTTSTFALLKDNSALLKETTVFIGTDFHKRERQYDLTIGNVEIKRGYGIDSIQVYLDGVLQKTAGVKITDSADTTGSICNKRDILLTFDDGTTSKLSTLLSPALTELKTLLDSLHEMYFAENVVDYIAMSIYYNSR